MGSYKVNDLSEKIETYMKKSDDNGRYLSFDHCFKYFNKNYKTGDDEVKNIMTLYFYAYMASWGMLRNSFLLYKDYLFNKSVVELLCAKRKDLGESITKLKDSPKAILNLKKAIINMYKYKNGEVKEKNENKYYKEEKKIIIDPREPDTLVSKAILGTLGIVPAYDRFFKFSAKYMGMYQSLTEKSLKQLNEFYDDNKEEIDNKCNKFNYPPMKIVDMYFWQKAYECSTLCRIIDETKNKTHDDKVKIENIRKMIKSSEENNEDLLLKLEISESDNLEDVRNKCENIIKLYYSDALKK